MDADWIQPEATGAGELTSSQVTSWRTAGFCLIDDFFPRAAMTELREIAASVFPEPDTAEAERIDDFGSGGRLAFPSEHATLNGVPLHPPLLRAIARLLEAEVTELRLTQCDLWAKYGRRETPKHPGDNDDQRIHVDYPNHTLTHPPEWDRPDAVEAILYLDDVDACGGATHVVARRGPDDPAYPWPIVDTPGIGELPWINDRATAEAYLREHAPETARWREEHLYARARPVRYGIGTLLLYRHDTWHRGTPLRPGTRRFAINLTFRRATSDWITPQHVGWSWSLYRPSHPLHRLLGSATPEERCVLGFPAPGDAYWTKGTIAAVDARYGAFGFDPRPYLDALAE